MRILKRITCLLLTLVLTKVDHAQVSQQYIDSVKEYVKQIDSIISEFGIDSASTVTRSSADLSSPQKGTGCASTEFYKDGKTENFYRLSYSGNCDSAFRLQDYYFSNNKIVFIRTVKSMDRSDASDQYYFNDVIVNPVKSELYINDGYEILKKFTN